MNKNTSPDGKTVRTQPETFRARSLSASLTYPCQTSGGG
jgi:hypothetical protein